MTNFRNTFFVFLWKVKKQKRFHWFKNTLFTLLPIILVIINFLILNEDESHLRHSAISEPITEVKKKMIVSFKCDKKILSKNTCNLICRPRIYVRMYVCYCKNIKQEMQKILLDVLQSLSYLWNQM